MKALLLNSGLGSRMGDLTKDNPKCLVNLTDNETILSRQIDILQKVGVDEFIITIGPFGDIIPITLKRCFHYCLSPM